MSLYAADGVRHFLSDHEIEVGDDGAPTPIDYEGRHFVFSHTTAIGGYDAEVHQRLYVFHEVQ